MKAIFTNKAFQEIINNKKIDEAIEEPFFEIIDKERVNFCEQKNLIVKPSEEEKSLKSKFYSIQKILTEKDETVSKSTFKTL